MKKIVIGLLILLSIGAFFFSQGGITGNVTGESTENLEQYNFFADPFKQSREITTCPDCNVILILIDTLRADHMGAYGYERNTTPNIDQLAKEGILFKNMLAQSSWTKPAAASIFTGLYPKNHQANEQYDKLSDKKLLLPEILKEAGYETYGFVNNPNVGQTAGFNQSYDLFKYLTHGEWTGTNYYKADEMNAVVLNHLDLLNEKNKQFLYVHYMDPHAPYIPPKKAFSLKNKGTYDADFFHGVNSGKIDKFEQAAAANDELINLYDDEILFNDLMVGELLDQLKQMGIMENAVVIIISDHGEEFYEHGNFFHGKNLFNEQLKVPWIMKVPGVEPRVVEKKVNQIDVLPTLLTVLDIAVPPVDGENVLDYDSRDISYAELNYKGLVMSSMQSNDAKLLAGVLTGESKVGNFSWATWFESEVILNFPEGIPDEPISLQGFWDPQELHVKVADFPVNTLRTEIRKKVLLEFPDEVKRSGATSVQIMSKTPCKKLTEIGLKDQRCLNFGIDLGESSDMQKADKLFPIQYYFNLLDDPNEKNNLMEDARYKNDLKAMESLLTKYRLENQQTSQPEKVQFSKDEEEALKSFGYLQ